MNTQQDPRFKNLEKKIGMFFILALAGIALVVLLVGFQRDLFSPKYTLHFTVDRGTGFTKGMPVKLSGFRIGKITDMALNEQAMVEITVELAKKYSKWIRIDSTVKLTKEGLVGDSIVEVAVGSLDSEELKPGDSITYLKAKGLDELADDIAEKVKPVLVEIRDIIGYINDPDGDLKKSIHNLEILTRNLESTRKNADNLLLASTRNLDSISSKTTGLLDNVSSKLDNIDLARLNLSLEKLPPLLEKADNSMANLIIVTDETGKLAKKAFPLIPGVLSRADTLLFSTDRLINSMSSSWLFGGDGGQKKDLLLRAGDSHD